MSRPRVLVVEDDRAVAYLLTRSLESMGCEVTLATDGAAALNLGLEEDFDLALLDHMLPGLLGAEILQQWTQKARGFPVLLVSAGGGEDEVVRALEMGAVDYVRKPFSVRELMARVRRHLVESNRMEGGVGG
jgi:DNA-binding response OmpR family regulator